MGRLQIKEGTTILKDTICSDMSLFARESKTSGLAQAAETAPKRLTEILTQWGPTVNKVDVRVTPWDNVERRLQRHREKETLK